MPGSLLLASNDAYSDLSYTSGRSLDSKTGPKKVSFNKAVRVKQYPWKPDLDRNTAEHLTLPSNRFWFKVYKNKHEQPSLSSYVEEPLQMSEWDEENIESTHDSLAPIAEVEDQDLDSNNLHSGLTVLEESANVTYNGNKGHKDYFSSNNNDFNYHPAEPPVDYFDEMNLSSNNTYSRAKKVWESNEQQNGSNIYNINNHFTNSPAWNRNDYEKHREILEEVDENYEERMYKSVQDSVTKSLKLPRMAFKNDSPLRHSIRKLDASENLKTRERRSRSQDDHFESDSRFKQLRKADKSVSTDDLNSDKNSPANKFSIRSRDMATQCYGTLNRVKNISTQKTQGISTNTHTPFSSNSDLERLKNFKSPTRRQNFTENLNSPIKYGHLKKETQEDEFSKRFPTSYDNQAKRNQLSSDRNLNFKKREFPVNGKFNIGSNKFLTRNENSIFREPLPKQNGKTGKEFLPRADLTSNSILHSDSTNTRVNNQTKVRDSATVGYLRGRQIPLSEVNTNTNRKFHSKNEIGSNRNSLFRKDSDHQPLPFSPSRSVKSDLSTSNGIQTKKYFSSNLENTNARNRKSDSHSAKSYTSLQNDGANSMIDWSLSGFQLSTKPDNGITSMSDSEYTVHRRPPLLMYIPGVSHHNRPAVEDDRLSALSDISRSEMNDALSSLASNISKSKNSTGDLRRRHSMPRDGKLKWIKWKNKV